MARLRHPSVEYTDEVRPLLNCVEYKGRVVDLDTGRIFGVQIATYADRGTGYRQIYLAKGKTMQAHRFIWEAAHGPIPDGFVVNHINGVKYDNRLENLELVTPSGNVRHAYSTGLAKGMKGQRHPGSKLNNVRVLAIRALAATGVSHTEIAAKVGVSRSTISMIVRRETWSHLAPFPARIEDM